MKKILFALCFIVVIGFSTASHGYEFFTIVDLTGPSLEKRLKNSGDERLRDIKLPYDVVYGSMKFERYNDKVLKTITRIFDDRVRSYTEKGGKRLNAKPVDVRKGIVTGIYLKEEDSAAYAEASRVLKSKEILLPLGIEGKYYAVGAEYPSGDCHITLLMNFTAASVSVPEQGSTLTFQVIAPQKAGCSSSLTRREARKVADYLEEKLENAK